MTVAGTSSASAVVVAVAAISSAIKACGSIVKVDPDNFVKIIEANPEGLYISSSGGLFKTHYKYLTSYRGLTFHCKTTTPIRFPNTAQVIGAKKIAIPDL